jgi:hypothetical protein
MRIVGATAGEAGVRSSCFRIIECVWLPAVLNFILLIGGGR